MGGVESGGNGGEEGSGGMISSASAKVLHCFGGSPASLCYGYGLCHCYLFGRGFLLFVHTSYPGNSQERQSKEKA